jgi:hypothetical protein
MFAPDLLIDFKLSKQTGHWTEMPPPPPGEVVVSRSWVGVSSMLSSAWLLAGESVRSTMIGDWASLGVNHGLGGILAKKEGVVAQ